MNKTPRKTKQASKPATAQAKPTTPKPAEPEAFDTLRAACAGMQLPLAVLQLAKSQGCGAFRSGRVYRAPLLAWLRAHAPEASQAQAVDLATLTRAEVDLEKSRAQCRIFIIKANLLDETTILKDEAKAEYFRAIGIIEDEAKGLMESDHYRIFIDRCKSRIGEILSKMKQSFETSV